MTRPSPDNIYELHRHLYHDDLNVRRLVSRQPPTTLDANTGELEVEDGTRIGMTMSGALLRRLGHPEGYGYVYPWMKALWLLRVECRRAHPQHRRDDRPHWRGALCHQAVKLVVIGGEANGVGPLTPEQAAQVLQLEDIGALLGRAFRFIEERMDDFRAQAEKRERERAGHGPGAVPTVEQGHHVPSEAHVSECPNPVCKARRAA